MYSEVEMFPSLKPIDSMVLTSSVEDKSTLKSAVIEEEQEVSFCGSSNSSVFVASFLPSSFSDLLGVKLSEGTAAVIVVFFSDDSVLDGSVVFEIAVLRAATDVSKKHKTNYDQKLQIFHTPNKIFEI